MTQLEQRFLETVPNELKKLNENISKMIELLEDGRTAENVLKDSVPLSDHSIIDSNGAAKLLISDLHHLDHEEVWVLLLSSEMKPMRKERINIGNLSQTTLDTRRIVKSAIDNMARGIILFHNHPSSNPKPSNADISMTSDLKKALELFSVELTDHIIIGGNGKTYYSFADEQVKSL